MSGLSDWLGGASIVAWLFAQAPQIYENYRRSSTSSLSLSFLFLWFAGDASNLIGCIMTDQLVFQTELAAYFVLVDCVLLGQWLHYRRQTPKLHRHFHGRYRDASVLPPAHEYTHAHMSWMNRSMPPHTVQTSTAVTPDLVASHYSEHRPSSIDAGPRPLLTQSLDRRGNMVAEAAMRASRSPSVPRRTGSVLLLATFALVGFSEFLGLLPRTDSSVAAWLEVPKQPVHINWQRLIGRTFSWMCATLYLSSRLPQVWHNYRHKSVEGLSALLFVAAFTGNLLYSLSILLSPVIKSDPTFLPESIPFLLGSGGTLCFDLTIMAQIVIYRRRRARKVLARRQRSLAKRGAEEETAALAASMSEDEDAETLSRPSRSRSIKHIPTIAEESHTGTPNGA